MLGKQKQQIKELERKLGFLQWEMYDVANAATDPDIANYHLGELQCIEMSIKAEIDELKHEIAMFPLKLMLGGFVIFVIGMIVYMAM